MSLNIALHAGLSGVLAHQKQVEVTGNNIANVNTPGYSRQTLTVSPGKAIDIRGLLLGQGVDVRTVDREYDNFVAGRLADQNDTLGKETAQSGPLAEIERILGIGENSLASEIEGFFGAWHDLSANPGGSVEREQVIYKGENLLSAFSQIEAGLVDVRGNLNDSLNAEVNGINLKLQEVAELNANIKDKLALGHVANNDLDRRDILVNELSEILGVQSFETGSGQIGLQLPGGVPLVQGKNAMSFEAYYDGGNLQVQIRAGNITLDTDRTNFGGKFEGLMELRDKFIPELEQDLDKLRSGIVTHVNAQHEAGYSLDGETGISFFSAGTDEISVAIDSTSQIAAAGITQGAPGDNVNALAIHALSSNELINGDHTFVDAYGRIAAKVGTETSRNTMAAQGAADTMTQLENLRESMVGVSLEQEMVNLTLFQRGFEASARFVQTIDEMMATLIGLKR
jgi:flagellar hook-associated protein 1 FlgK